MRDEQRTVKMKRGIVLLAFCLFAYFSKGQLTERLQHKMQEEPLSIHPVSISFVSSISFEEFTSTRVFINKTNAEKQIAINTHLIDQRNSSQKEVLEYLKSQEGTTAYQSFYIVNRIVANLNKKDILSISGMANINVLDLALGEIVFDKPIENQNQNQNKTTGATAEPGLVAINAPKMWDLGYTGRGRKVYVYDTGVWSEHPAFTDRFLGNYLPMEQAWYGHFSDQPNGNLGSHGTHVLGTIGGLDTVTSDTIGAAFGSYWMACDLINGGTAAGLPPQAELITAFEWALNPDGSVLSTHDIPDVINNSWRWLDNTDTTECYGFIPQLMNTIEAAGIANIFSGGNTGPNNNGVRSPQRINTTDVNTFTVGSVNANLPWPHPISSFSTRGPTQCPGSGSLQLFPEVVAPGQNVRSAWGTNGYNTISGTSMASPHVSGALLLLKEAFPQLTGTQLLQALYNSAIDMGAVGEDNVYGRGMIDVYAAYQDLALTHTPVDPNVPYWDVAVLSVNSNLPDYGCFNEIDPKIVLINNGDYAIDSVWLRATSNGFSFIYQKVATPSLLNRGDTAHIFPGFKFGVGGKTEFIITATIDSNEVDYVNNSRAIRVEGLKRYQLPYQEDFEDANDVAQDWTALNPDKWKTWKTDSVFGWPGNSTAFKMALSDYNPRAFQKDGLRSPEINLPTTKPKITLGYDVAYALRGNSPILVDSLNIYISEDCGYTFSKLKSIHGDDLKTRATNQPDFVPSSKSEWRREYIDISNYTAKWVVFIFESVNLRGNNIYIDNVSVFNGHVDPLTVEEEVDFEFKISPNPAQDFITIEVKQLSDYSYQVYDLTGKSVLEGTFVENSFGLDISKITSGMYYLSLSEGKNTTSKKFIKL